MGFVIQAVGRVRPFTSPAEIITMQSNDHPYEGYTKEFTNLEGARNFFGIHTQRKDNQLKMVRAIQIAKANGLSQSVAAETCQCSITTVGRYWNTTTIGGEDV